MTPLNVVFIDLDDPPPLEGQQVVDAGTLEDLFGLDSGTTNGKPSVVLVGTLPDGRRVTMQTTYALLHTALAACRGRWGEPA